MAPVLGLFFYSRDQFLGGMLPRAPGTVPVRWANAIRADYLSTSRRSSCEAVIACSAHAYEWHAKGD